jgi:hypothetical protein
MPSHSNHNLFLRQRNQPKPNRNLLPWQGRQPNQNSNLPLR